MCARVPEYSLNFKSGPISLNGTTTLAKEYEPAVAYFSSYQTKVLPTSRVLERDLLQIVKLYDLLVASGGTDNLDAFESLSTTDVNDKKQIIVERRRYVRHQKIERNSKAAKAAKKMVLSDESEPVSIFLAAASIRSRPTDATLQERRSGLA